MKGLSLLTATIVALPMVSCPQVLASDTSTNILSIERAASLFSNGQEVYIDGYGTANHLAASATTTDVAASDALSYLSIWTLEGASGTSDSEVYYIKNSLTGLYLGKTSTSLSDQKIQLTSDKADAGRYRVDSRSVGDVTYVMLTDIDGGSYPLLKVSTAGALVNGSEFTDTETETVDGRCFTLSSDLDADKTTLADELIAVYNDNYINTYTDENTGEQFNFIGDLEPTSAETELLIKLQIDPTNTDSYVALKKAIDEDLALPMTSNRRLQIEEGHYYHIESPYYGYTNRAIAETYYVKDYNPGQGRQRLHFMAWDEYTHFSVPTFWKFEEQDKKNGTDADAYFKIVAANSGLAMRRTGYNTIVDTRPIDYKEVGVYSYQKESTLIKHGHSVTLLGHNDNDARSKTYHLATFYDSSYEDYDIRESDKALDADDAVVENGKMSGANNWRIHEVTHVRLYFPQPTKTTFIDAHGETQTIDYTGSCYRSLYLPFAVQVPEGVTAYSVLDTHSVFGNNAFELAKITFTDGTKDIIPANTPAVLVGQGDKTYTFPILYDDTHSPVIFSLVGTTTPQAINDGEVIYVIDDLSDETGHTNNFIRKIGGTDYSYDKDDLYKTTGRAAESLYSSDATYIVDANHAYLKTGDENDPEYKGAENGHRVTTSNLDITVNRPTVNPEDMKYYDLSGRRVERPTHGIFIREDGVKILIP